jgi:hypothetical protein
LASTLVKRVVLTIIGLLAGLAAWPVAEVFLVLQSSFSSYFVFSTLLGIGFGLVLGAFFGSSEGIIQGSLQQSMSGMSFGAIVGMIGGGVGFFLGQAVLFLMGGLLIHSNKHLNAIGLPLSRTVGWAVMGIFIGLIEGVRAKSMAKIKVGVIGGFIGGILGGLALEYFKLLAPGLKQGRLAGLLIFSGLIGFFLGLVERRMSHGTLSILNGKNKGREYPIVQRKMRIGKSGRSEIKLQDYDKVLNTHAELRVDKDKVSIKRLKPEAHIWINEEPVEEKALEFNDVIKIGTARCMYSPR